MNWREGWHLACGLLFPRCRAADKGHLANLLEGFLSLLHRWAILWTSFGTEVDVKNTVILHCSLSKTLVMCICYLFPWLLHFPFLGDPIVSPLSRILLTLTFIVSVFLCHGDGQLCFNCCHDKIQRGEQLRFGGDSKTSPAFISQTWH